MRRVRVGGGLPRCHITAYMTLRAGDARKTVAEATSARARTASREGRGRVGRHGSEAAAMGSVGLRWRGKPKREAVTP